MDLEKELHRLSKIELSEDFIKISKERLMRRISAKADESWFTRVFSRASYVTPSQEFIRMSRIRLLSRIGVFEGAGLGWFGWFKRVTASTLAMAIAVTATLFYVEGGREVSAADNTYLEIQKGSVFLRHADSLTWLPAADFTELIAGDLIRVDADSFATVHFFDDTEMRLAENSLVFLNKIDVSPGYARQGALEASLHQGRAWVQSLSVDDGYAGFTLITRHAIISGRNTSFDAQSQLFSPTVIRTFHKGVDLRFLHPDTREVNGAGSIKPYQKTVLDGSTALFASDVMGEPLVAVGSSDLTKSDKNEAWIMGNLHKDRLHLADLKNKELNGLRASSGSMPGDVLYPVKRAKEKLGLVFVFDEEKQAQSKIDIANRRLGEAIVLLSEGQEEEAKRPLAEYRKFVKEVSDNKKTHDRDFTNKIVAEHQKTLVAALPGDARIAPVKQALDEAEELLADSDEDKARIKLKNSYEELVQVQHLITSGKLEEAKDLMQEGDILSFDIIESADDLSGDEEKKIFYSNILDTQNNKKKVLREIAKELAVSELTDYALVELVGKADRELDAEITRTASLVRPIMPDVALSESVSLPVDARVREFVEKVNIYKTYIGQSNQISRLLKKYPKYASDMEFLGEVRDALDAQGRIIISQRIAELKKERALLKHKDVKRKIDRARR